MLVKNHQFELTPIWRPCKGDPLVFRRDFWRQKIKLESLGYRMVLFV